MNPSLRPVLALLCLTASAAQAEGFNLVNCLGEHTKAECTRMMMIEDNQSKPLTAGQDVVAESGKYKITVQGDTWLKNSWNAEPEKRKDLGVIKDSGVGMLTLEPSTVRPLEFEAVITEELRQLYSGLQSGFAKGRITITLSSQMELMPLSIPGTTATLGRFCYHIDFKSGKDACVYNGYIAEGDNGQSYKVLGSVGDYDNMRAELETMITSFRFLPPDGATP